MASLNSKTYELRIGLHKPLLQLRTVILNLNSHEENKYSNLNQNPSTYSGREKLDNFFTATDYFYFYKKRWKIGERNSGELDLAAFKSFLCYS